VAPVDLQDTFNLRSFLMSVIANAGLSQERGEDSHKVDGLNDTVPNSCETSISSKTGETSILIETEPPD
jgi:hypothetical protein